MPDFLKSFFLFFNWKYTMLIYPFSREWDNELNRLMEKYDFTEIGRSTARIGGIEVWIDNHPYASFTRHNRLRIHDDDDYIRRPSRATIYRARKKLIFDNAAPLSPNSEEAMRERMLNKINKDLADVIATLEEGKKDN